MTVPQRGVRPPDPFQQRPSVHAPRPKFTGRHNRSTPEQLGGRPEHAKYDVGDEVSWERHRLPDKSATVIEVRSYEDQILYKLREPNNTQHWFAEGDLTKVS